MDNVNWTVDGTGQRIHFKTDFVPPLVKYKTSSLESRDYIWDPHNDVLKPVVDHNNSYNITMCIV